MSDIDRGSPLRQRRVFDMRMFADPVQQFKPENCYSLWITSRIETVHRQKCPDLEIDQHMEAG